MDQEILWNINDTAYHPKYGLVEIFEMYLGYANVFPVDEDKWGTSNRIVNISELQKPEKKMKQTLIKIADDHYVVVDDSEIKEGDWVVGCTRTVVQCMYPENVHHRDVKKITHSTQPIETFNWMGNSEKGYDTIKPLSLQEVKELIGEVDETEWQVTFDEQGKLRLV